MTRDFLLPGLLKKEIEYPDYRLIAKDCDIILWEPRDIYGRVIAASTGGPFCHASMACWIGSRLWDLGFHESFGGAGRPLKGMVDDNPGKMHVFRVREEFDREAVKEYFIDILHEPYNWAGIRRISLLYLLGVRLIPGVRRWLEEKIKDQDNAFCSEAIHASFLRKADGLYLCRTSSHTTSPNDIGRSGVTDYIGMLVPEKEE